MSPGVLGQRRGENKPVTFFLPVNVCLLIACFGAIWWSSGLVIVGKPPEICLLGS